MTWFLHFTIPAEKVPPHPGDTVSMPVDDGAEWLDLGVIECVALLRDGRRRVTLRFDPDLGDDPILVKSDGGPDEVEWATARDAKQASR